MTVDQYEAAHRHAEAALRDMQEMLSEGGMSPMLDAYDLTEQEDGRIRVNCGWDVVFLVNEAGEVEYS